RDADEAVDARLGAEVAEGVRALHHERGALDPRAFAGLLLEDLRLVPAPLRPAQVHPQQHLGPVLRLETARTGVDLDDRAAGVVLAAEELLELELVGVVLHLSEPRLELGERVPVALLRQLEEHLRLVGALAELLPAGDLPEDGRRLAPDRLRPRRVVPEPRRGGLLAQLGRAPLERRQVKDASRGP